MSGQLMELLKATDEPKTCEEYVIQLNNRLLARDIALEEQLRRDERKINELYETIRKQEQEYDELKQIIKEAARLDDAGDVYINLYHTNDDNLMIIEKLKRIIGLKEDTAET